MGDVFDTEKIASNMYSCYSADICPENKATRLPVSEGFTNVNTHFSQVLLQSKEENLPYFFTVSYFIIVGDAFTTM